VSPAELEPVRCWLTSDPLYIAYHDEEWGRPVRDEHRLLERLCLEGFQSGLAWITILRKRENFRAAFCDFRPERVARFGDADVQRLMADAGIVRNRAKIEATIANARATVALHDAGETLDSLLWSFVPDVPAPAPRSLQDMPATTAESKALARELKRRGFRFVGPTTAHALMQATGIVNDHLDTCLVRAAVEADRVAARTLS
jgi:DNA-3-methyladenine glycosylase I